VVPTLAGSTEPPILCRLCSVSTSGSGTTRSAVEFVAEESPHELRKRLFDAHRLACEGALAIEQLLQQEVLIKQEIDESKNVSAEMPEA
jgi:hypothetical protein